MDMKDKISVYDWFLNQNKKKAEKGGKGSGNWGHSGLAGVHGGSSGGGKGGSAPRKGQGWGGTDILPEGEGWGEGKPKKTPMPMAKPGETADEYAKRYSNTAMEEGRRDMQKVLSDAELIGEQFMGADKKGKDVHLFSLGMIASASVGYRDSDLLSMAYAAFEDSNMHSLNRGLLKDFGDVMKATEGSDYAVKTGSALSRKFFDAFSPSDLAQIFSVAFSNSGRNDISGFIKRNGVADKPTEMSPKK